MGIQEYRTTGGNRALLNEIHRKSDSLAQWQINFISAKEQQVYAFDQIGSGNHGIFDTEEYYPKSGNYDFRYKSVESGQTDRVIVDFGSYPQADSVIFKDKYGVKLKVVDGNILTFTGVNQADTNFIYAYRGDQKIGKLFLNTYQRKTYKVVLVSVNGAKIVNINNIDEAAKIVKESLDKVYNQCAVQFEISPDEFTLNDLTTFSHGGSGILTVYNDDQKRLLTAYEKEKKMQDKTYYLFFVNNVTDKKDGSGTSVSGYMPRGYNAGFIYDGGSPHTIAHELGHGIAGLEHVFENSSNSGKTANLMDYASDEELWHFQWDQIQDPSRVWMKWSKDESEGEWTTDGHYYLFTYLGMLMNMHYDDAERLGRYAEESDSHVFTKEDKQYVTMGDNKKVEVFKNYFEEGDILPEHKGKLIGKNLYTDGQGREIRFAKELLPYNWTSIKLTAQDIFNGYVDVKPHIKNPNVKDELNFRLYFNTKAIYMAENTTWAISELQQRNHALSSGYHGVELAITAYAIKNAQQLGMQQDINSYLLHRFGDVFAHSEYEGDEQDIISSKYEDVSLDKYICAIDYFFKTYVKYNQPIGGKKIPEDGIYQDGDMFYSTYNENYTKQQLIQFYLTTKSSIKRMSPDYQMLKQLLPKLVDDWNGNRDRKEKFFDDKVAKNATEVAQLPPPFGDLAINLMVQSGENTWDLLNYFGTYYSFWEFKKLLLEKVVNVKAKAIQNKKVMYGDAVTCVSGFTTGHQKPGTAPDEILRRPALFMLYVKRAAELLYIINTGNCNIDNAVKTKIKDAISPIQSAVQWGLKATQAPPTPGYNVSVQSRLDGVFSFLIECEKHKDANEFYVYIPIKFLPDEITGPIDDPMIGGMYSWVGTNIFDYNWDFTQSAENQKGVLEIYLANKGYYVDGPPKVVNHVDGDKTNKTPSYIGLKIKKK